MTELVLIEPLKTAGTQSIGRITLNTEKQLNAISLEMIQTLLSTLKAWQQDPTIACVFLEGAGDKAFCAGGDIQKLYHSIKQHGANENPYAENFFAQEYRLDYLIHTYQKPIICWGHGIVMGGGLGLMAGASHRIVTETSRLAFPEISIGLYPDVGGSWLLNRMPGKVGLYLGLTGASINAADALFVGLADRFILSSYKAQVLTALQNTVWSQDARQNHTAVSQILRNLERQSFSQQPLSKVRDHFDVINSLMDADSVVEIGKKLSQYSGNEDWIKKGIATFTKGSPTTAHLVYEQIKRGKQLSLKEIFMQELIMSVQCARHPDFPEGVRARLIEKDNKPQWQPASINAVTAAWIEQHFTSPWSKHPLTDL